MNKYFSSAILAMTLCVPAAGAFAQGFAVDNFDGYADQAALDAVWANDTAGVILKTDTGHSGANYVQTPTTAARKTRSINVTPTDASPTVVDFWIRVPSTGLGRTWIQIGDTAGANIVQYGINNGTAGTAGWSARIVGGAPTPDSNFSFVGTTTRPANTWVNLKFEMKSKDVNFYENGTLVGTKSRTSSNWPAMTLVKIGSNLSSTITADYDDLQVTGTAAAGVSDWSMY